MELNDDAAVEAALADHGFPVRLRDEAERDRMPLWVRAEMRKAADQIDTLASAVRARDSYIDRIAGVLGSPKDRNRLDEALGYVLASYRRRGEQAESALNEWERMATLMELSGPDQVYDTLIQRAESILTLEAENAALRQKLVEYNSHGPDGHNVTNLQYQNVCEELEALREMVQTIALWSRGMGELTEEARSVVGHTERALEAERIAAVHLREAFNVANKAANEREREVEALKKENATLRGELDGCCSHGVSESDDCPECEAAAEKYMAEVLFAKAKEGTNG
jgi:hypothetical protein